MGAPWLFNMAGGPPEDLQWLSGVCRQTCDSPPVFHIWGVKRVVWKMLAIGDSKMGQRRQQSAQGRHASGDSMGPTLQPNSATPNN